MYLAKRAVMIMVWISLRRMKSFIWTTSLLIICLAVDIIGCLQPNTEFSSPSVDSLQEKNCTAPKPPVANATLKWRPGCNNNIFVPGENAEFVCKEGFRQIGWLDTLRCERNGTWSSKSSVEEFKSSKGRSDLSGFCVTNHCNDSEVFNCGAHNETVDICKRCNCVADCHDGSDETDCGSILINVTGRATGEVKYPESTNTPDNKRVVRCSQTLWTDDSGFYIKLLFTKFSFRGDCEESYLYLKEATFSGSESPDCCKKNEDLCGFGAKSGAPPLSHSAKNFMTITIIDGSNSDSSEFTSQWFNVNGLFPHGVVPKDDPSYSHYIKIKKQRSKKIETKASDSTYVASVVILSILAFIVVSIVACKVGQRFIGPTCSLGYCRAWISVKRRQRSASRATSPETSPIRTDAYNGHPRVRSQGTVQANINPRVRYGSTEDIA